MLSTKTAVTIRILDTASHEFDQWHQSRASAYSDAVKLLCLSAGLGLVSIPLFGLRPINLNPSMFDPAVFWGLIEKDSYEIDVTNPLLFLLGCPALDSATSAINGILEAVKSDEDFIKDAMLQLARIFPDHHNSSVRVTENELHNLIMEFRNCKKGDPFSYEGFIKYLKQNGKKSELLTLIKLGADEKDCLSPIMPEAVFDKAQALCARSITGIGKDSLQWLSARAINNKVPLQDATKQAQELVNAAQIFKGLETKPKVEPEVKPEQRRRWTSMGIM